MTPITFAHRGGRADAPENTLAAFRRALEVGATGLESDARLSADGEVVLVHGDAIRVGMRRAKVRALPAARLAELGVPRLADLYAALGSDFELSLDLKEPDVAGPVLAAARHAGAVDRLWLCAREVSDLVAARRADPAVRLVHSMGRRAYGDALEGHASALAKEGIAALNLREGEWSLGLVILAHRFGLLAFAWDAQEYRRIRAVLQMGVDGIYSDHVERLVAAVGEWGVATEDPGR
ncbi:MAG TPA: glycerophosphodiester phosphodiesterase [Acidimicrobiia bacterium]|nr:glycerophosphodiester phosphodiesterase [Acidimicrobiia bacterium]